MHQTPSFRLTVGEHVAHPKFGLGSVLSVDREVVRVDFADERRRMIATSLTPLRRPISTDRETGLLEAAIAPAIRSRNPKRQKQGTRDLQVLGELAQDLSQRLFWRSLRNLVS